MTVVNDVSMTAVIMQVFRSRIIICPAYAQMKKRFNAQGIDGLIVSLTDYLVEDR